MPELPFQLGPFEVQREVGRGGMGVVYLGRDTTLDRPVAIKALPEHLAEDPERLARFEREARTLAQLSHPNVAGIYGVEEQDGTRYLVLEYVEGETLADRLARGAMPIQDAIETCAQIAAGVDAAHDSGIVHRDLKPANVKLTPDGRVKVLDFGLAKADDAQGTSAGSSTESPTITSPLSPHPEHSPTIAGAILGTAAYMSPEQARGRPVDKRTDIWSFGVILYECLTGAGPFAGETATDSIGAVLHKDVDLGPISRAAPAGVTRLLERCFRRDPARRQQSIGDARIELEDAARQLESGEGAHAQSSARRSVFWPAACVILVAALVGALVLRPAPSSTPSGGGLNISSMSQVTDENGIETHPALSPDGRTVVYGLRNGATRDIYSLRVGGENPINLTAGSGADDRDPTFSPDGEQIAFVSSRDGGGIFLMGATGENPRRITTGGFDPAWSPDGRRIMFTTDDVQDPYSRTMLGAIRVYDVETRQTTELDTGGTPGPMGTSFTDAVGAVWSPDGSRIAFWASASGQRDIFTAPASGGDRVALTSDVATDWNPMWSADGSRVLFVSDRLGRPNLWSVRVDPATGGPDGEPEPVTLGPAILEEAAISLDGSRIVFTSSIVRHRIHRVGFDLETETLTGEPRTVYESAREIIQPDATPDGGLIVARSGPPHEDLYLIDGDGSSHRRLTNDLFKDRGPQISDDGRAITFYSNRDGMYRVWEIQSDGTGMQPITPRDLGELTTHGWTPDRSLLAASRVSTDALRSFVFEQSESGGFSVHLPEILGFRVEEFSPDRSMLLGTLSLEAGGEALGVLDIETGEVMDVARLDGIPAPGVNAGSADWLDSTRVIAWHNTLATLFVVDVRTGRTQRVPSDLRGPIALTSANDGTELILVHQGLDSDVWLLEVEDGSEEQ